MTGLRLRDLARPLGALVLLHLALLLTWSIVVPTFRGADEQVHHDLVRHLTDTWAYPEFDGLDQSLRTLMALGDSPVHSAHSPAAVARDAPPRSERSAWADLGPDLRDGPPNQLPQHPPLYYESAAVALRAIDGDGTVPLDRVIWQLRLLSVLTLLPLPLIAADVARRFTSSVPVVLASAAGVLAVPQLTHVGAIVSNDPLMILLGSLTLAGAARVATGDHRWQTAAATGVAAGLALFTKGFAVPLVPAVALAALLPLRAVRRRRDRTAVLGRAGLTAGLALAFGGWWWIRNVVAYGTPQPGLRLRDRVDDVDVDVAEFARDFGDRLIGSFWGNFGWREVSLPIGVSLVLTLGLLLTVAVACWRRWERVVLVLPAVAGALMVLSAGWGAYKKTGVSYATQGRYLFTGVVGLSVLAALGVRQLSRRPLRRQATVGLLVALALQAAGLVLAVDRYWGGGGVDRVRAMGRFSPLPGVATTAILMAVPLSAVLALLALGATERRAVNRGDDDGSDHDPDHDGAAPGQVSDVAPAAADLRK